MARRRTPPVELPGVKPGARLMTVAGLAAHYGMTARQAKHLVDTLDGEGLAYRWAGKRVRYSACRGHAVVAFLR
jgi:hypothetical protein